MHFLFESHLKGYSVPTASPEFAMLTAFLSKMRGWRAYRAEWVVFAEEENIAGSIDFCAMDEAGNLALIDWERSSSLKTKYTSIHSTHPPLQHLPDCAGIHYRRQLSTCAYLVEQN